jgi:hypothetical protein
MHIYKLKTDCNGETDCKWKTIWQSQLKG